MFVHLNKSLHLFPVFLAPHKEMKTDLRLLHSTVDTPIIPLLLCTLLFDKEIATLRWFIEKRYIKPH